MSLVELVICPVCGSKKLAPDFSCIDYYATGESFEIEKCKACGFLFTQHFPSEESMDRYYDTKEYISHSDTTKGLVNKLYHIVRNTMMRKKASLVEAHTFTSSRWLLDIGCGTGYFLSQMSKRGWAVKGIEKNKEAREFAHRNLGVFSYSPEKINEIEELTLGVITLWHSLEHLENINETLTRINHLLVENGTVFIAVPNAASADAGYYKEIWAAYDVPRHLWHFTPDTMEIIAKKNGFGIEKMYPMPFDAFYVAMLSEKYKNNNLAFIKGFIVGLQCYFKALGDVRKSSSLIYVLRKSEILNFNT